MRLLNSARAWLSECLREPAAPSAVEAGDSPPRSRRARVAAACAIVFLAAFGVRLLHWRDGQAGFEAAPSMSTNLIKPYVHEVNRMREDGSILFPSQAPESQDARMVLHPPGYSLLLAITREDETADASHRFLRTLHMGFDSLSAVLVFLIASRFFASPLAIIAGLLVALSPHLANYSLWLTPETLAVVPVLLAVYLIAMGIRRGQLLFIVGAGALIGMSCWLRANNLLLAPFLALATLPLVGRGKRLAYAAALVVATAAVISPITLRNWKAYHRFIPISLGAGITMVEGIADYDREGRFGMPETDEQVKYKDAEWHNRPDYSRNIWVPDGVDRDRARLDRGLAVVRSNPIWFLGVMVRRAASMLRYNDSIRLGPTADIAHTPIVSAEPSFGHAPSVAGDSQPARSTSGAQLMAEGNAVSPRAEAVLADDGTTLRVTGDDSGYGDQFASAPVPVEKYSDYLLRVAFKVEQGQAAIKVTSADRRVTLSADSLAGPDEKTGRRAAKKAHAAEVDSPADDEPERVEGDDAQMLTANIPFATGDRPDVRLVISNNGAGHPIVRVGRAELFQLGPTPWLWSRYVRPPVRGIQRNLFTTSLMVPLVIAGVLLLATVRRGGAIVMLIAVPAYHLLLQSAFHTEYRYILAIHYFLFIFAAVTLYSAGRAIAQVTRSLIAGKRA